jgi:hypothetical protein
MDPIITILLLSLSFSSTNFSSHINDDIWKKHIQSDYKYQVSIIQLYKRAFALRVINNPLYWSDEIEMHDSFRTTMFHSCLYIHSKNYLSIVSSLHIAYHRWPKLLYCEESIGKTSGYSFLVHSRKILLQSFININVSSIIFTFLQYI